MGNKKVLGAVTIGMAMGIGAGVNGISTDTVQNSNAQGEQL